MITIYTIENCRYCTAAKVLLKRKGLEYKEIDVHNDWQKLSEMLRRSQRHSVPQVFRGDNHIGGYEELYQSFRAAG